VVKPVDQCLNALSYKLLGLMNPACENQAKMAAVGPKTTKRPMFPGRLVVLELGKAC
jgi:hypothetical protein